MLTLLFQMHVNIMLYKMWQLTTTGAENRPLRLAEAYLHSAIQPWRNMVYFPPPATLVTHTMTLYICTSCIGCPPKSGTLDFRYFEIRKYSIFFYFIRAEILSSEKNDTKIIEICWIVLILWAVIYENIVIVNFLFILVTFHSGIMTSHTLLPGSPLIRANKTKKELMQWRIYGGGGGGGGGLGGLTPPTPWAAK